MLALSTSLFLWSCHNLLWVWRRQKRAYEVTYFQGKADEESESLLGSGKVVGTFQPSFPSLVETSLGRTCGKIVRFMIACQQFGIILTYFIFVTTNVTSSLSTYISIKPQFVVFGITVIQIPLGTIRDISKLSPTNMIANFLIFYGLISVMIYAISFPHNPSDVPSDDVPDINDDDTGHNETSAFFADDEPGYERNLTLAPLRDKWYLFVGMSVLLMEGLITLIVPLQSATTEPKLAKEFPTILKSVVTCLISFYAVFGLVCWWSFGDEVHIVLTASLPPGPWSSSVQLAYSIAVLLTFPLQNFPALELITEGIYDTISDGRRGEHSVVIMGKVRSD